MRLYGATATAVGNVREVNEDRAWFGEPVAVLADGMGGHHGGALAAQLAVEQFQKARIDAPGDPARFEIADNDMAELVQAANHSVHGHATENGLPGMGTTLVTLTLQEGPRVLIANVGDSRAYRVVDDGLQQITEDHSFVEDLVRQGRLTREEAAVHPQRNIVTRAIGIGHDVDVDLFAVEDLCLGDRFLLCSDGLFNEVSESAILSILQDLDEPDLAAQALVAAALKTPCRDNVTVVVVDVVSDDDQRLETVDDAVDIATGPADDEGDPIESGLPEREEVNDYPHLADDGGGHDSVPASDATHPPDLRLTARDDRSAPDPEAQTAASDLAAQAAASTRNGRRSAGPETGPFGGPVRSGSALLAERQSAADVELPVGLTVEGEGGWAAVDEGQRTVDNGGDRTIIGEGDQTDDDGERFRTTAEFGPTEGQKKQRKGRRRLVVWSLLLPLVMVAGGVAAFLFFTPAYLLKRSADQPDTYAVFQGLPLETLALLDRPASSDKLADDADLSLVNDEVAAVCGDRFSSIDELSTCIIEYTAGFEPTDTDPDASADTSDTGVANPSNPSDPNQTSPTSTPAPAPTLASTSTPTSTSTPASALTPASTSTQPNG